MVDVLWASVAAECGAAYPLVRGYAAGLASGKDSGATFGRYWSMRKGHLLAGNPFERDDYFETSDGVVVDMMRVSQHCADLMGLLRQYDRQHAPTEPALFDAPELQGFIDSVMQSDMMRDIHAGLSNCQGGEANLLAVIMASISRHEPFVKQFSGEIMSYLETMSPEQIADVMTRIKQVACQCPGGAELVDTFMESWPQ